MIFGILIQGVCGLLNRFSCKFPWCCGGQSGLYPTLLQSCVLYQIALSSHSSMLIPVLSWEMWFTKCTYWAADKIELQSHPPQIKDSLTANSPFYLFPKGSNLLLFLTWRLAVFSLEKSLSVLSVGNKNGWIVLQRVIYLDSLGTLGISYSFLVLLVVIPSWDLGE